MQVSTGQPVPGSADTPRHAAPVSHVDSVHGVRDHGRDGVFSGGTVGGAAGHHTHGSFVPKALPAALGHGDARGSDATPPYRVGDVMYTCCSKDCVFPVLVLEGKVLHPGRPTSHGIRGVCLNWAAGSSHMQRYCAAPCDRFVRVDHFGRSDPRRGHSLGHKRRHPGRWVRFRHGVLGGFCLDVQLREPWALERPIVVAERPADGTSTRILIFCDVCVCVPAPPAVVKAV